ncbi:hypothetical protein F4821DRAFT_237520 [Hypoxylon rubiginosum]|uniref:Uncharacterized protein n=1 Tax=Hypoxylon rubiginosum TaxID=110542 RepID=A0ACC0D2A5_9PEZI|nr:hypothetical protein F4821DRAFT_237520 [Hypoxylon rubiginosum]
MTALITIISYLRAVLALSALALLVARETYTSWQLTRAAFASPSPPPLIIESTSTSTDSSIVMVPRALAGGGGSLGLGEVLVSKNMESYGVQDLYCRTENGSFVPVAECQV